ncbi:transporter substrate-binding domain-containing protein [Celeribacter arenosi]|uniref:Glutamine ABC transporter substrate-binding protein n=1 Tax=Celeribacter arenosi TaxID=792649 RepID=A0ABP7JYY7_9RHOB
MFCRAIFLLGLLVAPLTLSAQDLRVGTVTRLPFSMVENGKETGFSLDLWAEVASDLGREYEVERFSTFGDMLAAVEAGTVDAAVANISITAAREQVMDFSQPMFEGGLQIMTPIEGSGMPVWQLIMSREFLMWVAAAFAVLFGGGMLMWRLERERQPYFDLPARKAMFPAFWWALNLVVNGGFEERQPQSPLGRIIGVFMVISSLFIVSLFVARITSVLTVEAIQSNVSGLSDLYKRDVGTVAGSTSAEFLDRRDIRYIGYESPAEMLAAFEAGEINATVFDAPILAYYASHDARGKVELVGQAFLRESYGIALPSGSTLGEPINQSLLHLRENGTYSELYTKWFGTLGY